MRERVPPSFQFYVRDFLADGKVQVMTCEEIGAYLLLLCHQWLEGSVPASAAARARICKVSPRRMAAMEPQLTPCFPGGRNPRLEAVRADRCRFDDDLAAFKELQRQKGIASGAARRTKREPDANRGSTAVEPNVNQTANPASTEREPSATATANTPQHKKRVGERARATVFPQEFAPSEHHAAMAAELGLNISAEFSAFCDYHTSKKSLFVDWPAALRTWLRNATKFGGAPTPKQAYTTPTEDEIAAKYQRELQDRAKKFLAYGEIGRNEILRRLTESQRAELLAAVAEVGK